MHNSKRGFGSGLSQAKRRVSVLGSKLICFLAEGSGSCSKAVSLYLRLDDGVRNAGCPQQSSQVCMCECVFAPLILSGNSKVVNVEQASVNLHTILVLIRAKICGVVFINFYQVEDILCKKLS